MKKEIKCLIFDLDGTLLNTIDDIGNSVNKVLDNYGFKTHPIESYKQMVGNGLFNTIKSALPCPFKKDDNLVNNILDEMKSIYAMHWLDNTKPYENIIDLLKFLNEKNLPIAIVSNKSNPFTQGMVKHFFEDINFAFVIGESEAFPKKPDPKSTLHILTKLSTKPCDAVFIGDSDIDIETAKAAGINSISVTWGYRSRMELAKHSETILINSVQELKDYITQ